MAWLLMVHIAGGAVGLLSGAAAMIMAKGSRPHRMAGRVFVGSMLVMAILGGCIAAMAQVRISVLAAALSTYLVSSGWLAGRRADHQADLVDWLMLAAGISIVWYGSYLGIEARNGHADVLGSGFVVPATVYFIFTGMAAIGAISDAWLLARGGLARRGRLVQHLWRMSVALYIAASAFFSGQQDLFPAALRGTWLLQLPQLLVIGLLLFWLLRIALTKRLRFSAPAAPDPRTARRSPP